ncbi:MAG: sigma-70 family RNA polymerase sigma factor [Trueperaceae bacterium]
MRGSTDEELLALIGRRDELALRELYRRYAPYLKAMARRMTPDEDEADQCLQDTFFKVWEAARSFDRSKASVKTWMVTIAHRLMINRLRKKRVSTEELTDPERNLEASSPAPDHVTRMYVADALETLDADSRRLLELAFFRGHTHVELARITGRPLGSVKTTIRQALAHLREVMTGRRA